MAGPVWKEIPEGYGMFGICNGARGWVICVAPPFLLFSTLPLSSCSAFSRLTESLKCGHFRTKWRSKLSIRPHIGGTRLLPAKTGMGRYEPNHLHNSDNALTFAFDSCCCSNLCRTTRVILSHLLSIDFSNLCLDTPPTVCSKMSLISLIMPRGFVELRPPW